MNETNKSGLFIAFVVIVVLFLLFGGGAMNGTTMNGTTMNGGMIGGGISWMWLPTLLTLGIGILLGWAIFKKK